jgi:hypothetical protein
MGTFDEQTVTVDVPTIKEITRWEFVVNKVHLDENGDDDGGPDLDIFIYVGGERSEHRRQVPRAKVIAGWPGNLKAELISIYENAE